MPARFTRRTARITIAFIALVGSLPLASCAMKSNEKLPYFRANRDGEHAYDQRTTTERSYEVERIERTERIPAK